MLGVTPIPLAVRPAATCASIQGHHTPSSCAPFRAQDCRWVLHTSRQLCLLVAMPPLRLASWTAALCHVQQRTAYAVVNTRQTCLTPDTSHQFLHLWRPAILPKLTRGGVAEFSGLRSVACPTLQVWIWPRFGSSICGPLRRRSSRGPSPSWTPAPAQSGWCWR